MTHILVTLPDSEAAAFRAWLDERGYSHQEPSAEVPEWQQELVLSRISNAKPQDYSDWQDVMNRLRNRNK